VEFCAADIVDDRENPSYVRTRGTPSPKDQAYEEVARQRPAAQLTRRLTELSVSSAMPVDGTVNIAGNRSRE